MLRVTALFIMGLSFAAQADGIWGSADADHFAALDDIFNATSSTEPAAQTLAGWWTGRCYYHSNHDKAVASVMASQEVNPGLSHGPLFPVTPVTKVTLGIRTDRSADWFDELGLKGEASVKEFIADSLPNLTSLSSQDRSLMFESFLPSSKPMRYRIRRAVTSSSAYFVVKGTLLKDTGEQHEGDTYSLCYYFDKVKVNPSHVEETAEAPQTGIPFPGVTADCVCDGANRWVAACPTAVGVWAGGRREPGINVRRCGELNPAEPATPACTPGATKNIYTSPAPAITNLCG